ncbi:MAG: sigma-70 family RNA polymerase sigma factor [Actinobacteria bacterium]|nr:sigma-70 family RNA polymerase sigma factor [Actinomycetota bacterium]
MTVVGAADRPASPEARFNALFARHYPAVFGYAARRVGRDEAGDAAAEVFTVVWRRLGRVPAEPETLPWLYGVTRKVVANQERAARRRLRLQARTAALPAGAVPPPGTTGLEVEAALLRLAAADREILRLAAWEELQPAEMAAVLGCSANAAAVRLHRARQRLAGELSPETRP